MSTTEVCEWWETYCTGCSGHLCAKGEAAKSAQHWEALATEAENRAAYERGIGLDLSAPGCSVGDHQARTYRDTAKALRLEAETGKPHCSVCFKDHPNHKHRHLG